MLLIKWSLNCINQSMRTQKPFPMSKAYQDMWDERSRIESDVGNSEGEEKKWKRHNSSQILSTVVLFGDSSLEAITKAEFDTVQESKEVCANDVEPR
jgi:hypothetical protein